MKKNLCGPAVSSTRLLDILTELVAALESGIIYYDNGAWCIGMHGDTDVTDIIGKPIADAKDVLTNEQVRRDSAAPERTQRRAPVACSACGGKGTRLMGYPWHMGWTIPCPACNGTGKQNDKAQFRSKAK